MAIALDTFELLRVVARVGWFARAVSFNGGSIAWEVSRCCRIVLLGCRVVVLDWSVSPIILFQTVLDVIRASSRSNTVAGSKVWRLGSQWFGVDLLKECL